MQTALKDLQQVALENEEEDEEDGEKFEEEADEGNRADDSADRQVDEPAVLEDDKLKKEAV